MKIGMYRSIVVILGCLFLLPQPVRSSHSSSTVADDEAGQAASSHSATSRKEALVILNGKELAVEGPESPFAKQEWGLGLDKNRDRGENEQKRFYYVLNESKNVWYVPNFLNISTAMELKGFCLNSNRFVSSPIRASVDDESGTTTRREGYRRTSESCAMVPASNYLGNAELTAMREQHMKNPRTAIVWREVDVTWEISERAAQLVGRAATTAEPLQIVRYTSPDAFYSVHHDHGGFYGKTTELRPWTVLVFLNDVAQGGHTWFPELDLRVVPRGGDAIAWSNVDGGQPDPEMVHAGEPPSEHGVEKYAVNVWFRESALEKTTASEAWGSVNTEL